MNKRLHSKNNFKKIYVSVFFSFLFLFSTINAQLITQATGGTNVSLDGSSAGISPTWTTLSGPVVTETIIGQFVASDYYVFLPSNWAFDTTQPVTVTISGGDATFSLSSSTYYATSGNLIIHVSTASTTKPVTLTFSNIRVQPKDTAPSSGDLNSTLKNNVSFGLLTTAIGAERAFRLTASTNTPVAGANNWLSISLTDQFQNLITTFTGYKYLTFSGLGTAPDGISIPTVTNNNAAATPLGNSTIIHFTNGVSDAGGLLIPYKAEGPVTLNATDETLSTTSPGGTGVSLTVSPAPIDYSSTTVTVSNNIIKPNSTATVTLQAKDIYDNNIKTGGAAVVFSLSGGTSTGTFGAVTDNNNGSYTSIFTGTGEGTDVTINATFAGVAVTSTLPTIKVASPGIASAYRIVAANNTTSTGVADQLTITIVDNNQLIVADFTGVKSLTFSGLNISPDSTFLPTITNSSGTAISIGQPTDIHFTNGVSDAGALLKTYKAEGPVTLNTTDGTLSTTTQGGSGASLTVSPNSVSYLKSQVKVSASAINPSSKDTVNLITKDAYGNNLTIGGATVVFSISGGTSTGVFGTVADNSDGSYTSIFTGGVPGSPVTVNATYNGNNITSPLPTIKVVPLTISTAKSTVSISSSTVAAGSSILITLQAKNETGTNLTSGGGNVNFSYSGGTSTGVISVVADNGDGTYSATFTGNKAGTAITIIATVSDSTVTTTMPTITVTYGTVSYLKAVPEDSTMITGTTNEITLTANDLFGNVVKSYSGIKTISFTGLQGSETIEGQTTSANVNFTNGVSVAGSITFTAFISRNAFLNFSDGVIGTSGNITYAAYIVISPAVPAPVATAATAITKTGFIANWVLTTGATEYFLDIATDDTFESPVSGYINLNVGNVNYKSISGLDGNTTYYYRVRAGNSNSVSENSNVIQVKTLVSKPNAPTAIAAT